MIESIKPTCGATLPAVHDPGWTCDGERLVMVMSGIGPLSSGSQMVPVVIREDLVWLCDKPVRDMIRRYGTRPFAGGDHMHLTVRKD